MKTFDKVLISLMAFILLLFGCIVVDAVASPGLKMQVPPFDAEIYQLRDEDTGDSLTWAECVELAEAYKVKMSNESAFLAQAIESGEFIVECVELDADGKPLPDSEVM